MGKFWIDNELIDKYLTKISGNDFKVWCILSRHFNKKGTCYPSIRTISIKSGLHHETVSQCLKRLKLLGFFEQLEIKERCKLRCLFSKTARFLIPGNDNLLEETAMKDNKEDLKEIKNNFNSSETEAIGNIMRNQEALAKLKNKVDEINSKKQSNQI
ncbi:MAG: helix-turn-helix domain-containing protein [Parcubacteria group bacterium]|jgi:hypothetical protein